MFVLFAQISPFRKIFAPLSSNAFSCKQCGSSQHHFLWLFNNIFIAGFIDGMWILVIMETSEGNCNFLFWKVWSYSCLNVFARDYHSFNRICSVQTAWLWPARPRVNQMGLGGKYTEAKTKITEEYTDTEVLGFFGIGCPFASVLWKGLTPAFLSILGPGHPYMQQPTQTMWSACSFCWVTMPR